MEALIGLANKVGAFLAGAALPIGALVVAFNTVKALIGGSLDRALKTLVIQALIVAVLVGSLQNVDQTKELLSLAGTGIWGAIYEALRTAF